MKKLTILFILFLFAINGLLGQNIAFVYDADGNMTSRYVATLRSAMVTEEEKGITESPTVELLQQKITIFPNPTKGQITVEILPFDSQQKMFFRLFSISGKILNSDKINWEQTEVEIIGGPGIYLLDIHIGENVSRWKIVKE